MQKTSALATTALILSSFFFNGCNSAERIKVEAPTGGSDQPNLASQQKDAKATDPELQKVFTHLSKLELSTAKLLQVIHRYDHVADNGYSYYINKEDYSILTSYPASVSTFRTGIISEFKNVPRTRTDPYGAEMNNILDSVGDAESDIASVYLAGTGSYSYVSQERFDQLRGLLYQVQETLARMQAPTDKIIIDTSKANKPGDANRSKSQSVIDLSKNTITVYSNSNSNSNSNSAKK